MQVLSRISSLDTGTSGLSVEVAEQVLYEIAQLKSLVLERKNSYASCTAAPDTVVIDNPFQVESFYDFMESDEFYAHVKQSFFSFAPFLLELRY